MKINKKKMCLAEIIILPKSNSFCFHFGCPNYKKKKEPPIVSSKQNYCCHFSFSYIFNSIILPYKHASNFHGNKFNSVSCPN